MPILPVAKLKANIGPTNPVITICPILIARQGCPQVVSIGGTDIVTGKALPALALIAKVPSDPGMQVTVTPLSTLLSVSSDPDTLLENLGIAGVSAETLIGLDPWELATGGDTDEGSERAGELGLSTAALDEVVKKAVTLSVQIAALVQIADTTIADTTSTGVQSLEERADGCCDGRN